MFGLPLFSYRIVFGEVVGSLLLGHTTNLADQDDSLGLGILEEDLQAVDEVGAVERITADAHAEGLSQTHLGGLVHSLVGQGSRPRDNADLAALVNMTRHDADLALQREIESK